jgi:hypothetical protein
MIVAEFRKPPLTIKMVHEIACGPENSSESRMTYKSTRIFPASSKWRTQTSANDAAFGTTLE